VLKILILPFNFSNYGVFKPQILDFWTKIFRQEENFPTISDSPKFMGGDNSPPPCHDTTMCVCCVCVLWRADSGQMSSTMCALSSVARLSVSMTMLMSSGAHRRRLYVDGTVGGSAGPAAQAAEPTPPAAPSAQSNRPAHHRHLWKTNPKRAAAASTSSTVGRALAHRGGPLPARIESLPNMWNDLLSTPPESVASARRVVYSRRRPQASSSLSAIRAQQRSRPGARTTL